MWVIEQMEFAKTVNQCVVRIHNGEKLSSKQVHTNLKSSIKNEAIRKARKAVTDFKQKRSKSLPVFRSSIGISINNQNWNTIYKNGHWYLSFCTSEKKVTMPVIESKQVITYFPFLTKEHRSFRHTITLLRKGKGWYIAIPIQISSELPTNKKIEKSYTCIGVDLGLRHLAVVSEPISGKRQFFSGKEVGYKRRHFRSLRRSLGMKKAQRAIERIGKKESRWMKNYNRNLAKDIVFFANQFEHPIIKMELLQDIRQNSRTLTPADRTIHNWAFYQLKLFINEAARKYNIPVVDINPYQTSQRCFHCGHVDKKSRDKQFFRCTSCGHKDHADHNASKNIASSTSLAV
jgi:putative transposase